MHKTDTVAVELLLFCMLGCCAGVSLQGESRDSEEASPHVQKAVHGLTYTKCITVWNDMHL